MRTKEIFQSKIAPWVTACVNMTGNKKARRDAGLFDACDVRPDRPIERMLLDHSRAYLASLAICAVSRETLRLALFL